MRADGERVRGGFLMAALNRSVKWSCDDASAAVPHARKPPTHTVEGSIEIG